MWQVTSGVRQASRLHVVGYKRCTIGVAFTCGRLRLVYDSYRTPPACYRTPNVTYPRRNLPHVNAKVYVTNGKWSSTLPTSEHQSILPLEVSKFPRKLAITYAPSNIKFYSSDYGIARICLFTNIKIELRKMLND